jgi:flagellar basal-body rod modification protein FlgD
MTDAVSSVSSTGGTPTTKSQTSGASGLGKQDFLALLVAQLKNQDPMKPMEDREFITQLAQFSSLESLQNLDKQLEANGSNQLFSQATGVIGKKVTATLADGSSLSGIVTEARLVNATPRLVIDGKEVELGQVKSVASQ